MKPSKRRLMESRYEAFARVVDRRAILRTGATAIFAGVTAALAFPAKRAVATGACPNPNEGVDCSPLNGQYCSGCVSGSACPSGCSIWTGEYSDGCWCTQSVKIGLCTWRWYTCCDCHNGSCGSGCSCRFYHDTYTGSPVGPDAVQPNC
jgi:hypothetical protein